MGSYLHNIENARQIFSEKLEDQGLEDGKYVQYAWLIQQDNIIVLIKAFAWTKHWFKQEIKKSWININKMV